MTKTTILPLWVKILAIATLNFAILAGLFVAFIAAFDPDFDLFVQVLARHKLGQVSRSIAASLQGRNLEAWPSVLHSHSHSFAIEMRLYRDTGKLLAGKPPTIEMPSSFKAWIPGEWLGGNDPPPYFSDVFGDITSGDPKYWVGVRMPTIGTPNGKVRSVLIMTSSTLTGNRFFFDYRPFGVLAVVAIAASALCWLPLARNATRSISEMMRASGRIAEGRFDLDMRISRRDELGRLSQSIKQMASRLKFLTEGRQRFLHAVAHELRSPIARMQLTAEILERDTGESSHKYLSYLRDDIQTMSQLTDELLQLARAESLGLESVKVKPTSIAAAVEAALRKENSSGVDVRVTVDPVLQAQAHLEYLERALSNTLRNAIYYAATDGPILIAARRDAQKVVITIRDSGPGVPEGALDKLFSPFYRVDDARDRRTGGTGLGLAIVRNCIESCGGTVECRNSHPGLEVVITLNAA